MPMRNSQPPTMLARKVGSFSRPSRITGCGVRRAWRTNSTTQIVPERPRRRSRTASGIRCPPEAKPSISRARPTPDSRKPTKSSGGMFSSLMFGMNRMREEDPEDPDRDVDEEDPAPVEIGGDEPAEHRPEDRSRPSPGWSASPAPARPRCAARCAAAPAGRPAPSWPRPCPGGSARSTKPSSELATRAGERARHEDRRAPP